MDDKQPKYLNTAKTPVFDKGRNLFSLNFAKDSNSTRLILAEGYMDVIAINQAGFSNVVATLGTAITPEQARKISNYAKEVIIAYDSMVPDRQPHRRQSAISARSGCQHESCTCPVPRIRTNTSNGSDRSASGCCWNRREMPSTFSWSAARRGWMLPQMPEKSSF